MKTGENAQYHPYSCHTTRAALCLVACVSLSFTLGWHANSGGNVEIHPPAQPAVYFSPKGGIKQTIADNILRAHEEILVALYYFTDPGLADTLIEAHQRGVRVHIILDKSQRNGKHSQARKLSDAGLSVVFDSKHRIFHHKFMVIDKAIVVTGSQNWTKSAEHHNAENILHLQNNELAAQFCDQFMSLLQSIKNDKS